VRRVHGDGRVQEAAETLLVDWSIRRRIGHLARARSPRSVHWRTVPWLTLHWQDRPVRLRLIRSRCRVVCHISPLPQHIITRCALPGPGQHRGDSLTGELPSDMGEARSPLRPRPYALGESNAYRASAFSASMRERRASPCPSAPRCCFSRRPTASRPSSARSSPRRPEAGQRAGEHEEPGAVPAPSVRSHRFVPAPARPARLRTWCPLRSEHPDDGKDDARPLSVTAGHGHPMRNVRVQVQYAIPGSRPGTRPRSF
jgi:hypothetical protein